MLEDLITLMNFFVLVWTLVYMCTFFFNMIFSSFFSFLILETEYDSSFCSLGGFLGLYLYVPVIGALLELEMMLNMVLTSGILDYIELLMDLASKVFCSSELSKFSNMLLFKDMFGGWFGLSFLCFYGFIGAIF